jgi:RHS repeat-associated protein
LTSLAIASVSDTSKYIKNRCIENYTPVFLLKSGYICSTSGKATSGNITFTAAQSIDLTVGFEATPSFFASIGTSGGMSTTTQDYVGGIEYKNNTLEAMYHAEGRAYRSGTTWQYEYTLKDHLGNSRVTFRDKNGVAELLQENHYYPFGMNQEGKWASTPNKYQYNGKELNEDLGLNWNDYGARWYDAAIGRWNSIDPLVGLYLKTSPYAYVLNSPIRHIDPNGMMAMPATSSEYDRNGINIWGDTKIQGDGGTVGKSGSLIEPVKKQAGNICAFICVFDSTPNKVGQSRGLEAASNLSKFGETEWSGGRPLPKKTPYFNNKPARYIYTSNGGWIDMVHFLFYAGKAYNYKQQGKNTPIGSAVQDGYMQERSDALGFAKHSAFSYEDLPTDKYGADFAVNHFDPDSNIPLSDQIEKYMVQVLGATDPQFAPNYSELPAADGERQTPTYQNHSTIPLFIKN